MDHTPVSGLSKATALRCRHLLK